MVENLSLICGILDGIRCSKQGLDIMISYSDEEFYCNEKMSIAFERQDV